jgi:glycosyltransferase involved in cell wall biosynthesis
MRDVIWKNYLIGLDIAEDDYIFFPNISVPNKLRKYKYGVLVHDLGSWHTPENMNWRGRLVIKSLPDVLARAEHIFAVSEYTADDISRTFSILPKRIIVTPNGLSHFFSRVYPESLKPYQQEFLDDSYFLHVGTFEPKKNIHFLLDVYEVYRKLSASLRPAKLILTGGESWKSSSLFTSIDTHPYKKDIFILGKVLSENLPSLYRNALALIFPSTFEGFGLPVIEALSQGTPAIVNSNTSLIQFARFGATVFDHFDASVWANELLILAETKVRVSLENVDKVKENFDWGQTAVKILRSIYSQ